MPENERLFPIVQEAVQHKMKHNMVKAGVKKIRVHDLRHSHVAYLINKGIEPILIKERLGHKDIRITLNTYIRISNGELQICWIMNKKKVPTAATVRTKDNRINLCYPMYIQAKYSRGFLR